MWPCGWCCAPGRDELDSCLPGSRGTPGALGSTSWAGWGDRPRNGSWWGTHPSPAESLPYSSRGTVSRCLHSWKQSGFVWHITVQLISPCTPYHKEPHGYLGVTLLLSFQLEGLHKPKASCEQVLSGRLGQPWGHQEKVWEGPAGGWGEADKAGVGSQVFPSACQVETAICPKTWNSLWKDTAPSAVTKPSFSTSLTSNSLTPLFFLYATRVCGVSGRACWVDWMFRVQGCYSRLWSLLQVSPNLLSPLHLSKNGDI